MLASPGLQRNCSALTDLLLLDRHMEAAGGTRESQAALLMHPGGMRAAGVGGAVTRLEAATRGRAHRAALEARRLPGRQQRRSTCTVLRRLLSAASRCRLCALSSSGLVPLLNWLLEGVAFLVVCTVQVINQRKLICRPADPCATSCQLLVYMLPVMCTYLAGFV